jgi:hypothetical protein
LFARRPHARVAVAAPARALALAAASVLALALALLLAVPREATGATDLVPSTWTVVDSATFEIYQDDRQLGDEEYRAYRTNDTLIMGSAMRLPGAPEGSLLPVAKNTTFLRRALDAWPLVFQVFETPRDTAAARSISCAFNDTTVIVFHEVGGVGSGTALALPPGRLYLLEPGIYAQVQTLVGDFVKSSQNQRKQPVLIPSAKAIVDVQLKRGEPERLGQEGRVVETTKVELTDNYVKLVAWVDAEGRMWKLEAPGQGLRVERALTADMPKARPAGRKKGATKG